MSGCCAIHYSAAVVRQYMAALMFYLKWHVIAMLNLSENMLFKMCTVQLEEEELKYLAL